MLKIKIDLDEVNGSPTGKFVYVVVIVDTDDSEDTRTEFWRADSEEELADLIEEKFKEYINEDAGQAIFDDAWGSTILIGSFHEIDESKD